MIVVIPLAVMDVDFDNDVCGHLHFR